MARIRSADTAQLRRAIRAGAFLLAIAMPSSTVAADGPTPAVGRSPDRPAATPQLTRSSEARLGDALLLDGVGAGLPSDGVAAPPSRDVRGVLRAQADATNTNRAFAPAAFPAFATLGYVQRPVPLASHPYTLATPIPLVDPGTHDGAGVRMVRIGSTLFDHPVAQASYGLANLSSFDLTGDDRYLDRAIAQATRLVDTKIVSRDAWYFPYPFDFALHGRSTETLQAPWYSAMAQGMGVSLFVGLFQRTNEDKWSTAAAGAVASFRNPPEDGLPWVMHVDGDGYLWLEEYPVEPHWRSDFTFNGHGFATFGLYDYATLTGDPLTILLFDGAATTTRRYGMLPAPDGFRTRSWLSAYCLRHGVLDAKYHGIVTQQLIGVHSLTADALFARVSDAYRADYPANQSSRVRFAAGSWTGYVFDSQGGILKRKTVGFSRTSSAPSDRYARIKGRGLYYRITAGSFKGYWVAERAGLVHATGQYGMARYYPERRATFHAGTTTGYRFDSAGQRLTSRRISLSGTSSAPFDQTAMFGGRRYAHITAGRLTGYWVLTSDVTLL
jgi:hypothetical protein